MAQQPDTKPPLSAAERMAADRASRKARTVPAPKAPAVAVRAVETDTALPPSLGGQEGPGVTQSGDTTGEGASGAQKATQPPVDTAPPVVQAAPVAPPPVVAQPPVAQAPPPPPVQPVAAPVQPPPPPVASPPVAPPVGHQVAIIAAPAAPRLPSQAALTRPQSTMDPVLFGAYTRMLEILLMSLRSTWDKLEGKQGELDTTVDQARAMGYPEEEFQRLAAQHRWMIPPPDGQQQ